MSARKPTSTPTKAPSGAGAAKEDGDNFRARRLSMTNVDTSEFDRKSQETPDKANRRQRRLSMSPEMGVQLTAPPFLLETVGTYSCHGVEPAGSQVGKTSAKINQDRGCVCYPFGPDAALETTQALFCVYDGHGVYGDKVSHYAMHNIQAKLEVHPQIMSNPGAALREVFLQVDAELEKDPSIDAELSGTTAVVCLVRWTKGGKGKIWVANVGDSRAVLGVKERGGWKAHDLSIDQKPDTPAEKLRIVGKGGFVSPPEEEWGGPARVWLDQHMTLPGLAMARSIGDHLVGKIGVIAEPEITEIEIEPARDGKSDGVQFLVIASDGVWEFLESKDAVGILVEDGRVERSATEAVTKLIERAAHKWRAEEGDYRDDITALCIRLPDLFKLG